MRWGLWLAAVCLFAGLASELFADSEAADKQAAKRAAAEKELAAIRAASVEFAAAFNKGNAKAVAAHWTADGDYTSEDGETFTGRDAIEKQYGAFFAGNKNIRIQIVIDSLRLLSDSAAIEDGRAILDPAPAGAPAISKYTAVHVKGDGKWLMSTVRDTRLETPSGYRHVADLEFLIGKWNAEEHGAKTESVCRWIANKSFVERSYSVTHADHTTTSGVQLIGFNPHLGVIQSWNFSSDGGHAVAIWTAADNGWTAEVQGTTGDGKPTFAVNTLRKLDDNAYMWQSTQRTVSGVAIPDTDEVIMKRVSAGR